MKKITFILFALIAGTSFAQENVQGTAEVVATIVQPLTISSEGNLNFGLISAPETASSVTLSPENVRDIPSNMTVPSNTTTTVPIFTVTKETGLTYKLVTGKTDLKLDGETDMVISAITTNLDELTNNTAESFKVGATIGVNANQGAGNYQGEIAITVSYE